MRGWNTCFATRFAPPCQGDGTPLIATSSIQDEQARRAPSKKMPLSNLCSRLIVTGTRQTALFSSLELTPYRPPRPVLSLGPGTLVPNETQSVHGDAD
jgi:hypothetical protein